MKRTILLLALLIVAGSVYAQPGTPHAMMGMMYWNGGTRLHEDIGVAFYNATYNFGTFYYNYPGHEDTAAGTSYDPPTGELQIQLSVMLVHQAGNVIHVDFIDNISGDTYTEEFIRDGGAWTNMNHLYFGDPSDWTLSGNIGMAGVTFTATGTVETQDVSDEYGDWAFECEDGADVTITPSKEGYVFDPAVLELLAVSENMSGIEFTWTSLAPDAPINPYPADGATGVAGELPYLWWDAPEGGEVAPTSYFVTLSANADYSAPIIDNMETVDPMYAVPATSLMNATMYYAKVVPHYAPPARATDGLKKDTSIRKVTKATKVRDYGAALEWSFETYDSGDVQNGGNCNGADPVVIELEFVTVIINPAAGVNALIIIDWTTVAGNMPGYGSPAVELPGFIFGLNIEAGNPANLNGTIEIEVGEGYDISAVFYHNDGAEWVEVVAPASWTYVGGILTIQGLNLMTRTGGDIEIAVHDSTVPVEFSAFNATFMVDQGNVLLNWTTETETDMMGYYVLRSETGNQDEAIRINPTIIEAANTSIETKYQLVDEINVEEVAPCAYTYWIEAIENNGYTMFHGPQNVLIEESKPEMPAFTQLEGAYPNPFNPETTIKFNVAEGETAKLTIYNVLGQVVKTFGTYEAQVDMHEVVWHGTDNNNNNVGSGIYFYRLESDSYKCIKKMLLLK